MTSFNSKWLRRGSGVLLLVYLAALITGTHLPHPEVLIPIESNDKWLHFGAYFGLAFLMATRLQTLRPVTRSAMLAIWGLAALTGIVDIVAERLTNPDSVKRFFSRRQTNPKRQRGRCHGSPSLAHRVRLGKPRSCARDCRIGVSAKSGFCQHPARLRYTRPPSLSERDHS
ncbi:MAG: hypothetical protein FD138_1040 [Planctomycetota bacterium]|nr:MAG: hypothetical protein FD138_1040 [Planctomycetota bacterium]